MTIEKDSYPLAALDALDALAAPAAPTSAAEYVSAFARLFRNGVAVPATQQNGPAHITSQRPLIAICSPHPDDECLVGGVALRLREELSAQLLNIPFSYGRNPESWPRRKVELQNACTALNMALYPLPPGTMGNIYTTEKKRNPTQWQSHVEKVASILRELKPDILILPHAHDHHPAHIGTHQLVMEALPLLPCFSCQIILTEWWHPNSNANMLLQLSDAHVEHMLKALCAHEGEIARNPYHKFLPASLMEQVRRGSEIVGTRDKKIPDFVFGQLVEWLEYRDGQTTAANPKIVGIQDKLSGAGAAH